MRALIGPPSSGRSSLLRRLAHEIAEEAVTLRVARGQHDAASLLKTLLGAARLSGEDLGLEEMRRLIGVYIDEQLAARKRVVIETDDADRLGEAAWRELEALQSARAGKATGLELLLSLRHLDEASSPAAAFVRRSESPSLAVLQWMTAADIGWYLHWRLERFGLTGLFTPPAIRLLARCTEGRFAAVDCLCQMVLLLLRSGEREQADVILVREAARALQQRRRLDAKTKLDGCLIVSRAGRVMRRVPLTRRMLIGRNGLNDLTLDSDYLSRHHAAIMRADETGYFISDLNSVNGLLLNGRRVQAAPINDGDVICIGPFRIKVALAEGTLRESEPPDAPGVEGLSETMEMPIPAIQEPAHLKLVK